MNFETYLQEKLHGTQKLYYNYMGIYKKEYPKWPGWKLIQEYRETGVDIKRSDDYLLSLLVRNFYYTQFLQDKYINNKF
jgi:hypothetical protein